MKRKMAELEEESAKIDGLQQEVEATAEATAADKTEADQRSIFVGNVDYGSTPEELQSTFHPCGPINRITILCDKYTGHPKGYAYIEFADKDSAANALALNETPFRGRQLQVTMKRTNLPHMSSPRGRGRFRGRFRGSPRYRGGYPSYPPRGRFHHRSRSAYYSPY
eukprot:GCRY01000910.1.p1 GENE.GCRY01000910.1~~GCRY01000910.1.p1  ORF type:complete len:166 (+),score=27.18 GCRY01000910.1:208-705(+)